MPQYTVDQFAELIKSKHPDYSEIDNVTLTTKMVEKFPQYKTMVSFSEQSKPVGTGATASFDGEIKTSRLPKEKIEAPSVIEKPLEFATGVGKTIPKTILGATAAVLPDKIEPPQIKEGIKSLEPKTSAEAAGQTVGNVAQFLLPTTNVAKGLSFLDKAVKLAKTQKEAALMQKAIPVLKTIFNESAQAGAVTAAQEGEINKTALGSAATAGVLTGTTPAIKKAASFAKQQIGKTPERIINSLVKPLKRHVAYGKDPARTIVAEGITANSIEELGSKVQQTKQKIGKEIGDKLANYSSPISISTTEVVAPLAAKLDELKKYPSANASSINRIQGLIDDITNQKVENINTLTDLSLFKQEIGDLTKFTGNESDDEIVNTALRKTYDVLKKKIEKEVPEIQKLNEKYGDLLSADLAIKNREIIGGRQNILPFTSKQLGGAVGALTAVAQGSIGIEAILSGIAAASLESALGSVASKTRIANLISKLSKAQKAQIMQSKTKNAALLRKAFQGILAQGGEEEAE